MQKDSALISATKYFPGGMPSKWTCSNFCHDEPKLNLLWLVCPEIDSLIDNEWGGNKVSSSIDKHMSKDVRAKLNLPPVEFMQWFAGKSNWFSITHDWPDHYLTTMWSRARLANKRLITSPGDNVYQFDFRAGRK